MTNPRVTGGRELRVDCCLLYTLTNEGRATPPFFGGRYRMDLLAERVKPAVCRSLFNQVIEHSSTRRGHYEQIPRLKSRCFCCRITGQYPLQTLLERDFSSNIVAVAVYSHSILDIIIHWGYVFTSNRETHFPVDA